MGYRPQKIFFEHGEPFFKRIRRDNFAVQALTLPKISNYNMRSLIPKIGNFSLDMNERSVDIAFLSEVWQKLENKKHQFKLEELLEMEGVQYISTPRPGAKRGGGAAIAVRLDKFSIKKINVVIPSGLEVVWGMLKPRVISGKITKIISCCFYSPPRSRKRSALVDHITLTLQQLMTAHPGGRYCDIW